MGIIRPMEPTPHNSPTVSAEIRFTDVGRVFGSRVVLKGLGGSVHGGEVLVVSGSNGSGKSTLLRILAGLLNPSHGEVTWNVAEHQLGVQNLHSQMGFTAPDFALYRELTAVENLQFFASLRGLHLSRSQLADLLLKVGLKGRGRDLVGNYSSGMRQRLKLAFAVMHQPTFLLLDEPTATLDEAGRAVVRAVIEEQRKQGLCILATNERAELEWGDRVLSLAGSEA